MYSFSSSPSRPSLHLIVISTLVAGISLFCLSNVPSLPLPALFQLGGVALLVVAVYFTARYSLRAYRYAIEPNGVVDVHGVEQYDLVITEMMGKKCKVMARIGLRDISEVAVVRRTDKAARAAAREGLCRDRRIVRYANTPIMPEECYIAVPEEETVVVIPADKHMEAILRGARQKPKKPAYDNFKD